MQNISAASFRRNLPRGQDGLESSVALMARIGSCWSPSFSPDGSQFAFVSTLNGIPQVWTVATDGGWPRLVTALDDQIYGVSWSPDGSLLAFNLAPGGGMNQQVYVVSPDGTGLRRLTDGGKENNWFDSWTRDGSSLLMTSNRRRADTMDSYLVHVESGEMRLISENGGIGYCSDVSRDGAYALIARMHNRSDNDLYLIDLRTATETLLTPHEGPATFGRGTFSPDGRTVYLLSNYLPDNPKQELLAFCQISLGEDDTPGPIELLAEREDAELDGFDITEDGKTAALLWNVAGFNELDFLDLATSTVSAGPTLPAEIALPPVFSRDGNLLALNLSGAAAPWPQMWPIPELP